MKAGIIVYSQTGNTLKVAERLKERLEVAGHSASLEKITAEGDVSGPSHSFTLKNSPDVSQYDKVILGAPVMGFSLNPVMKAYLNQLTTLDGKKVYCFITKGLPFYWTGGKNTMEMMKKACFMKKAEILGTGFINWTDKNKEASIDKLADDIKASLF